MLHGFLHKWSLGSGSCTSDPTSLSVDLVESACLSLYSFDIPFVSSSSKGCLSNHNSSIAFLFRSAITHKFIPAIINQAQSTFDPRKALRCPSAFQRLTKTTLLINPILHHTSLICIHMLFCIHMLPLHYVQHYYCDTSYSTVFFIFILITVLFGSVCTVFLTCLLTFFILTNTNYPHVFVMSKCA
jgi:hypothetical protein